MHLSQMSYGQLLGFIGSFVPSCPMKINPSELIQRPIAKATTSATPTEIKIRLNMDLE